MNSEILSENEVEEILKTIKESSGFTDYSNEELYNYIDDNRIIILRSESGNLYGIAAYKFFSDNWVEITTLVVLPKYQGSGLGKQLWNQALSKLSGNNIFVMAINPLVKEKFAIKSGFMQKKIIELPFPVQIFSVLQRLRLNKIKGFLNKKNIKFKDLAFFIKLRDQ